MHNNSKKNCPPSRCSASWATQPFWILANGGGLKLNQNNASVGTYCHIIIMASTYFPSFSQNSREYAKDNTCHPHLSNMNKT